MRCLRLGDRKGVLATVAVRRVLVGDQRLLADAGVEAGDLIAVADRLSEENTTPSLVTVDGLPAG
ncbi:MAG: hypothetical protein ABIP03_03715, partial [Aquihabitans sp.]